ncbi:MAG TPA: PepSY domain-containing protein [Burkholderiales bacterium]|nr:PepSY domain-containing protein [Burkholderiales bacterium]
MNRILKLSIASTLALGAIGAGYAANAENDAHVINDAKISLSQAVSAAEQHAGGKASRAEVERHKGEWIYDVEVVAGKKVMDVKVDPQKGTILSATEDKVDHDDDHDKQD